MERTKNYPIMSFDDGNILGLYATGLADEDLKRSVEDRIEREIQAAADRLSAHDLVRLRAALREPRA